MFVSMVRAYLYKASEVLYFMVGFWPYPSGWKGLPGKTH